MSKNQAAQIVHETETQRQHVRVTLPARAEINGKDYTVKDLSSGGIGVTGFKGALKKGEIFHFTLILPFADFSLDTYLEAQVQNIDKDLTTLGARFVNLSSTQITLISHVIRTFISGDIVEADEMLDVVKRHDFMRIRSEAEKEASHKWGFKAWAGLLAIALLGAALVTFIFSNIYHSLFFITANTGVISAQALDVKAPVFGKFQSSLNANTVEVKEGDVIGRVILTGRGPENALLMTSPCTCYIAETYAQNGAFVETGDPVFSLVPLNTRPVVDVFMNAQAAQSLSVNDRAKMRILGSAQEFEGRVSDIVFDRRVFENAASEIKPIRISIEPEQKLPLGFIGKAVTTDFKRF